MGKETLQLRKVENIDEWELLKKVLLAKGYKAFQFQYVAEQAEGFHAWFLSKTTSVEVITHSLEVQEGIIKYNSLC